MKISVDKAIRKYFIMGSHNCKQDPVAILETAAKAGITIFQFREKGPSSLSGKEKLHFGKNLHAVCKKYNIPFIVNDDVELVELLDADGIHVGQDDISVEVLRERFPNKIIGLSVSTRKELENSPLHLVDYIGAGPIFPTTTKADAKAVVGLNWIKEVRKQYPDLPIVGIGGINTTNAASVLQSGANGVSFITAITQTDNIKKTVQQL